MFVALYTIRTIKIKNKLPPKYIIDADLLVVCDIFSELITAMRKINIPYMPEIETLAKLLLGIQHNFSLFKFFPAILNGGMKTLYSFVSFSNTIFQV